MKNPIIDLSKTDLTGRDLEIAKKVLGRSNRLRSSKPKDDGEAAYVWRMCAFLISTNRQHWSMPVTADFDLPYPYWDRDDVHGAAEKRRARCAELKKIEDAIVNTVPKEEWHGVRRWARAMF
jgi:hypothetical protein